MRSIALIGLSGSGKSTVAGLLAAQPGWSSVDTDSLIVERIGCPIAELFARAGEAAFRDLETETLRAVLPDPPAPAASPLVVATGGGIILRAENRRLLRDRAYVVWLDAPTTALVARLLAHTEERPLLAGSAPTERVEALRSARQHLYSETAHQRIDTLGLEPAQVVAQVLAGYRGTLA